MGLCARAGALMHTNAMRSVPPPAASPSSDAKGGIFDPSRSRHLYAPPHLKDPVAHARASVLKRREERIRARRRYKVVGGRLETVEGDIFFLKEIFLKRRENAAQLRIGSGGVLSQQLVTQTQALSRVSWSSARLQRLSRSDG